MAQGSTLHDTFCQRARDRRVELTLTQDEVARRMQISQPAYAAIETGRSVPTLAQVERVAKALKTEPCDLLAEAVPAA